MFDKTESQKVKGIAICMLVFHHLFYSAQRMQAAGMEFSLLPEWAVTRIGTGMRLCVWMFALISAYGLTVQFSKLPDRPSPGEIGGFLCRRWLSLMKPYWIVFAVVFGANLLITGEPLEIFGGTVSGGVLSFLGLSDLFGTPMPVASWWYMCFAQVQLLCIPVFALISKKIGLWLMPAAFVLRYLFPAGIQSRFGGDYYNYLFVTILGVYLAQHRSFEKFPEQKEGLLRRVLGAGAILASVVLIMELNRRYAAVDSWKILKVLVAAAAALMALFSYRYVTHPALSRFFGFMGRYSGYIFLLHSFGYTYFPGAVYWSHGMVLSYGTLLGVSTVCAVVLDRAVRTKKGEPFFPPLTAGASRRFTGEDSLAVKGAALILLVILHLFYRSSAAWGLFRYNPQWMVDGMPLITALFSGGCGKVCMDLFVLISGFGLAESFRCRTADRGTMAQAYGYMWQKLRNFLYGYWFVFLVFTAAFTLVGKINLETTYGTSGRFWLAAILDFLGLRDLLFEVFGTGTVNPTWWYLSVILLTYALFPVFRRMAGSRYGPVCLVLLCGIWLYAPYARYRQIKTGAIYYLPMFYLGILCSEYRILDRLKSSSGRHRWLRLAGVPVLLSAAWWLTYRDRYRGEPLLAIAWVLALTELVLRKDALLRGLKSGLVFLGRHSGNIFLFHTFFLFKLPQLTYCLKSPLLITAFFLTMMTAVSMLVEKGRALTETMLRPRSEA